MLGFHDASLWRMPAALEERTATALQTAGFAGLEVDMHGQRAALSGIVESEDDIAAAAQVALTSAGGGGPWAGGVTSVDTSGVAVGVRAAVQLERAARASASCCRPCCAKARDRNSCAPRAVRSPISKPWTCIVAVARHRPTSPTLPRSRARRRTAGDG
ncbi:MAG: hypothetical protein R3C16_05675 [Hyphomonadaceae bacterium]